MNIYIPWLKKQFNELENIFIPHSIHGFLWDAGIHCKEVFLHVPSLISFFFKINGQVIAAQISLSKNSFDPAIPWTYEVTGEENQLKKYSGW